MIPSIGVLIGIYAIARLLQVPLEASASPKRWIPLLVISLPAIAVIGFLMLDLLVTGTRVQELPPALR